MGEVYLAEDTELGREVALKVLPAVMEESPERLERFRREARAVASLNHPNIVTLFNVEEAEGRRLLVMERVEGKSLDRVLPPGGMPLAEVFAYAIPMADALAAAHAKGITHRDLKPANVMITDDGNVKVLDFGLAKLAAEATDQIAAPDAATEAPTQSAALTGEGTVMGTAPYMSPEQLSGKEVDSRTDIFSFGILLYEMVTGKRPFQGDSGIELASSILKDTPSTVTEVRDDLPRHLGRIIQHCLEKDPERRYQSAKDIRNELEGLKTEVDSGTLETFTSGPVVAVSGPQSVVAKRPWGLWAAVGAAIIILVLGVVWWRGKETGQPEATGVSAQSEVTRTVAVLPLVNLGTNEDLNYLRLAVPDEIATTLSRGHGLTIRPFSTTARLDTDGLDPLAVGRELGVGSVVLGQYFQEGDQLSLTLEAIDVGGNAVLWRDSVEVGSHELVSLRQAVAERIEQGLMPILDPTAAVGSSGTVPSNEEAYDLYLRSLTFADEVTPNSEAIALIERAVELDPNYAPAWGELAKRYYYHANYGLGGQEFYDRAVETAERALDLDPDLAQPRHDLILMSVELGDLASAYAAATQAIEERPKAGWTYFSRSYVLRYAGALELSARDCDTALALDPKNSGFRSCAVVNSVLGRYERAEQFLDLDAGSSMVENNRALIYLRQGQLEEGLEILSGLSFGVSPTHEIVRAIAAGEPLPRERIQQIVDINLARQDSEQLYWMAVPLAFGGEHEAALQLFRGAIEGGYCSFPAIDIDPMLEGLRADPAVADTWSEVRAAGKACHERFVAETGTS